MIFIQRTLEGEINVDKILQKYFCWPSYKYLCYTHTLTYVCVFYVCVCACVCVIVSVSVCVGVCVYVFD